MTPSVKTVNLTPSVIEAMNAAGTRTARITDARAAYERVPLVFRATRIRCNSFLSIPRHLTARRGETEVEYPFGDLDALLWKTQASILLAGGAAILKQRNTVRTVGTRWLNPFTVKVEWNAALNRREFTQTINGKRFPAQGVWTDEDIIFIREFGLSDDIGFGTASGMVALSDARLKNYLKEMAGTFFEAGGMPVTVLSVASGFADKDERARVESFFKRIITGARNFGRVLAVGGDMKITTTQAPLKDLAIPDLEDAARKDIARAFELPVTLLDSDETFATAVEHRRSYYDDTVIPAGKLIVSGLNEQHFHPIGLHLELAPEEMDIYQEDENLNAQSARVFLDLVLNSPDFETFQLAAGTYGMEYDEELARQVFAAKGQRAAVVAANMRPAQETAAEDAQDTAGEPDDSEDVPPGKRIEAAQFRKFVSKRGLERAHLFEFRALDEDEQAKVWADAGALKMAYGSPAHRAAMKTFEDRTRKHEAKVRGVVTDLFEKQARDVARRVGSSKAVPNIGDAADWLDEFIAAISPVLRGIVGDAAAQSIEDYALGISFDLFDPAVNEFIKTRAQRFAEEVNATTWDKLKASLQEGNAAGETIPELAARVQQVMGDRIRSSAEVISRTETISAYNAGTMESWGQSGVVKGKTWLATLDARVRDAHADAHGQTVALDKPFDVSGESLMYPGDSAGSAGNVINCRCTVTAVLD